MAASDQDPTEVMSQINVTPLVDVLLVLLLVLMVSASAAVARALDVTLPRAASGASEASTLTLRIDALGGCWMGEQLLDLEGLRARLRALGSPETMSVVLAADGAVQHHHVIAIMDLLRGERITKLAFAVSALEPAP